MDTTELWNKALADIELTISRANFSTWFKNTSIARIEAGNVQLAVQNEFVKDWLSTKYHSMITKVLRDISDSIKGVEYIIAKNEANQKPELAPRQMVSVTQTPNTELPLSDLYIGKEDNLNSRYVFESFIIGPFNELAYAAAKAIIKGPGTVYNPFFVYGNTGIGKTHLTQAIGNEIKRSWPGKKIQYLTSEKFATDYLNSLQQNKVGEFKEKYRKYDVLIMDDIQFLAGKEKTQEELFHVFNTLYEINRQIVFSSDKHPNYITGLEDRLKSRFGAGMIVEMTVPEYESRLAILRAKVAQSGILISQEVMEYVANTIQSSIRELEGTLNLIICQAQIKNRPLTINDIRSLIKNNTKPTKPISIKDIVKAVTEFYNIDERFIYEKTRRKEVVKPRQILMYILREDFSISYPMIGNKLGGRDHTTVIHSCEKVKRDIKTDALLGQELEQIRALF